MLNTLAFPERHKQQRKNGHGSVLTGPLWLLCGGQLKGPEGGQTRGGGSCHDLGDQGARDGSERDLLCFEARQTLVG